MTDDNSVLVVPLRSNASTLLAGAPVAVMRRRLKFASLFFDRMYLEAGVFRMHAGPGGSFGVIEPAGDKPRWQTAAQRSAEQASSFHLGMGRETTPGVPAPVMHTVLASSTSHSWAATLEPFASEFPAGCDWVEFVKTVDPVGDLSRIAGDWTWADERNPALERAIPERFVRGAVIKNANRDLVGASASRMAVTVDPLHSQVVAQRFNDDDSWKLRGYVVPVVFPHVGNLPWEAIVDIRHHRAMTRFRGILHEVEAEVAAEAVDGDYKAVANRMYRRHLAEASEAAQSIGTIAHKTLTGFVIGGVMGFATSAMTGPIGIVAAAALGAAPGAVLDVRSMVKQGRSKGWVSLSQRIDSSA